MHDDIHSLLSLVLFKRRAVLVIFQMSKLPLFSVLTMDVNFDSHVYYDIFKISKRFRQRFENEIGHVTTTETMKTKGGCVFLTKSGKDKEGAIIRCRF